MTKKRVSINGITRWKEINPAPQQVAPVVEEAKTVPLRQAIGEVLRDVRQRQGRTLREVSQSARVSLGYLSEVERGQKEASSELLDAISEALGVPLWYILREVSERMAERIKIHVGSALTDLGEEAPEDYMVHGPNRITALPMEVPVCYQEIAHCLDKTVAKIENAVLSALEATPPELYADSVKNGIYLTGGGALLRGLDKRLQDKINIPFHIAEDPLHSVARGAGIALKNVNRFSFLKR